jgi:serine/threonine protein kinase
MQPGTRELGRSVITQIVGLPRSERIRALQEFFPNDQLSQNEILSMLDLYDALGVAADGGAFGSTPSQTPLDEIELLPPDAPSSAQLQVGESYGPYRVVRPIGAGGMGQVFLAEDIRLGRHVALKSLAGKWLASPSARQRLMREARAVGVLAHSNIATLYDVLEADARLLLVMEYVDGKTVKEMIDAGPMPAGQALRVAAQVAAAIGYAHDRGVIHCDLKPANIQVTSDGIAKVLDFGLARVKYAEADAAEKSLTGTGVMLGTPGYVAPERLLSGVLNASGDIYSIGVVLFEMVTGRRLFERGQTPEHLFDAMNGRTMKASAVVGSLPQGLDDVIERALSVDPRLRYQSAHELSRDVQVLLKSLDTASIALPLPATQTAARAETAPITERRLPPYGMAAAAVGISVVALAGFTTSGVYNLGLGRTSEFDPESPLMHLYWGVRSLIGPALRGVAALIAISLIMTIAKLSLKVSEPVTQKLMPATARTRILSSIRTIPVSVIAPLLLIAELVAVVLLWSRFEPLFASVITFINRTADGGLTALSPANVAEHRSFRQLFSFHLLIFAAAWFQLLRFRARQATREAGIVVAGGLALTLLSLLLLVGPYRIMVHNEAERVLLGTQVCFLVGQRSADALLFCPTQPPPWSRVVRLDDPQFKRSGTSDSIFKEAR